MLRVLIFNLFYAFIPRGKKRVFKRIISAKKFIVSMNAVERIL